MSTNESAARWWRIGGRTGNIIVGALSTLAGLRLCLSGEVGLCLFEGISGFMADIVGIGLIVGGVLLLVPGTAAVVGLLGVTIWIMLWTWALPSSGLWGGQPCWLSALVLAGLFLNMGVMGLSDRGRFPEKMNLMLFFALCFFGHAAILWLRAS